MLVQSAVLSRRARALSRGAAHALIGLAFVAWLGMGLYGISAPGIWGHYGFHSAEYTIRARHTLRSGSIIPGNHPGWAEPKTGTYYVHHPILTHQLVTLSLWIGGDWDYSARSAALAVSTLSFVLLVLIVRRWWGVWPAALAAWGFVLVPVNVWFSNHIDPGFPSIACLLAFFWFYLRWLETARWSHMLGALGFAFLAGGFEWSPYLLAAPVGLHTLGVGIRRRGRYLAFIPLYFIANVAPFVAHGYIVQSVGQWEESSVGFADRTRSPPYEQFLDQLLSLADVMLTRELVYLIGAWFVLLLGRLFLKKLRHRDLIAVSFLFAVGLYAHVFTSGFFVHAYRILYANVVSAIALSEVVMAAGTIVGWLAHQARLRSWGRINFVLRLLTRLGVLAACYAIVPQAWAALDESRLHGGVPRWTRYNPTLDRVRVAKFVRDASLPGDRVIVHRSWGEVRKEVEWYLDRDVRRDVISLVQVTHGNVETGDTLVMMAAPKLSSSDRSALAELCAKHPITVLGAYIVLDLRKPFPRVRAYRIEDRVPRSDLGRYLIGPYAMPGLERNASAEVDYRLLCGVAGDDARAELPMPAKTDVDGLVRHHNYALLAGDRAAAGRSRALIDRAMTIRRVSEPTGLLRDHLLGARLAGRTLSIYLTVPEKVALRGVLEVTVSEPGKPRKQFDQTLQPPAPELRPGFIHAQRVTLVLGRGETRIEVGLRRPNEGASRDAGADAGVSAATPVLSGVVKR